MTLEELLNLKIIYDNARILVDSTGSGNITHEFNITRIMCRLLTKDDLLNKGVLPEMLQYEVKELWGDKDINKMGIVIQKEGKKMIKLTTEEKNALDELTHKNKMDCWFWIDDENDCIRDLEDDERILDTATAVLEVLEGTPDISEFLDEKQCAIINGLYNRIKEEEDK